MLDPIRLVTDLFKEKNLSDANLRTFAEVFLIRLSQPDNNPGGIYNQLLLNTTTLYQNYYGTITNQLTKEAIGQGTTIAMNNARAKVIAKLSSLQGLVQFKFGESSAIYQEFYPRGMKEYHHATIDGLTTPLMRYRTTAALRLNADYPGEVTEVTGLINSFLDARKTQELVYAEVDAIATGRHTHRKKLTLQLTKCFLVIASDHLENPDQFDNYYEPRYLPIRKGKKKEKG